MITVIGASGFIGGRLIEELQRRGTAHSAPGRDEELAGRELGDVVYCAGVTTDSRARPLDTVDAHVGSVERLLRTAVAGEALVLSSGTPALILRLANVYGVDPGSVNFLPSIIGDALRHGRVTLRSSLETTRNYVGIDDALRALLALMRPAHAGSTTSRSRGR